jgi:hypothetical protein
MTRPTLTAGAIATLLLALLWTGGAPAATGPELQAARDELRLRTQTQQRMRRDFESLLAEGRMSATEIADFEDYLVRLGSLVDQQRRVVATLEGTDGADPSTATPLPAGFDRGQTDEEKIASLDAELGDSLSAFDEKLLREQKEIADKTRPASTGDGRGKSDESDGTSAKAGEGQGKGQGEDKGDERNAGAEGASGKSGSESAEGDAGKAGQSEQDAEAGEQAEQGEKGRNGAEGEDQVASAETAGGSGGHAGKTNTPSDIGDGKDDDIVARQLREAAENEQDPELREKLWDEYRIYKSSTR